MIIVTGGAGFIGSNILAALEREMRSGERAFDDLVVVDRLRNGDKWRNIAKRELAEIVAPERLPEFLAANVSEIDAIVHMGAISATTERDVDLIAESNIRLTRFLWDFCRDEEKRLIFASSAATYGGGELGFDDRDDLEYLNALRPLNAYGWSKAFIDRKIARDVALGRKTPKQFVGLKFFNVYGPNEYHKADKNPSSRIFTRWSSATKKRCFSNRTTRIIATASNSATLFGLATSRTSFFGRWTIRPFRDCLTLEAAKREAFTTWRKRRGTLPERRRKSRLKICRKNYGANINISRRRIWQSCAPPDTTNRRRLLKRASGFTCKNF